MTIQQVARVRCSRLDSMEHSVGQHLREQSPALPSHLAQNQSRRRSCECWQSRIVAEIIRQRSQRGVRRVGHRLRPICGGLRLRKNRFLLP